MLVSSSRRVGGRRPGWIRLVPVRFRYDKPGRGEEGLIPDPVGSVFGGQVTDDHSWRVGVVGGCARLSVILTHTAQYAEVNITA